MSFSNPADNIFPLPEIQGAAVVSSDKRILISTRSMNYNMGIVDRVTYYYHLKDREFSFHVHFANKDLLHFRLGETRASLFDVWLGKNGLQISAHPGGLTISHIPTGPTGPDYIVGRGTLSFGPPPVKSVCPVCYGTGFFKGFGGPCSSGCRPVRE